MRSLALVATVLSLLSASPARAVEFRSRGTRLIIKDMSGTKKLVFLSKDPAVPFGAPVPGGPDDPSVVGAYTEFQAPTPVVVGTCGLSGLCVPAH
jgi:hypothetical protein